MARRHSALLCRLCRHRLLVFPPLYGQVAFRLLAGFVEHRPRRHVSGDFALGARLHPALSDFVRHLFLRQDDHRAVLAAADVLSRRPALCLPSVQAFAHATACEGFGCGADTHRRGRGRCRRSIARHRKRCGQKSAAGRHPVALGGRSGFGYQARSGAGPAERSRGDRHRIGRTESPRRPSDFDAERARARAASRNNVDAGTAARTDDQPIAIARGRRGGAAARAGQCRGPLAAAERADRLP